MHGGRGAKSQIDEYGNVILYDPNNGDDVQSQSRSIMARGNNLDLGSKMDLERQQANDDLDRQAQAVLDQLDAMSADEGEKMNEEENDELA